MWKVPLWLLALGPILLANCATPALAGDGRGFCLEMIDEWYRCWDEAADRSDLACPRATARIVYVYKHSIPDVSDIALKDEIAGAYQAWTDDTRQILVRTEDSNAKVDRTVGQLDALVIECHRLQEMDNDQ